jgi:pimeloyl-ACP methyl ester carboxylesterase
VGSRLREAGHDVAAFDLPGSADDRTPIADVTLDSLALSVTRVLERVATPDDPAILVGHSMGGVAITRAAELRPDLIGRLVFVTAMLMRAGEACVPLLQQHSAGSLIAQEGSMLVSETGLTASLGPGIPEQLFYGQCREEDRQWALARLRPDLALLPLLTPLSVTPERYGRLPRSYVLTTKDEALLPSFQEAMIEASPCDDVRELESDHSPWLCRPEELTAYLVDWAK